MTIKTPIGRVRGLGAAKQGVGHFTAQRATAIALVPLVIWLLASIVAFSAADFDAAMIYLRKPVVAVLMLLFLATAFTHMRLGVKVVIEDYIHREGTKIALLLLLNFFTIAIGGLAIFAVLKIAISPYP